MATYGFTGTINDLQYARMQALHGARVAAETPTAWVATATANPREVSIAAGSGWISGLRHETTGATTIANASNSSGSTRYDLIVWRADWTAKTVTLTAITGTPGAGIPSAITKSMLTTGVVYDMPLVVCRTISGGGAYTAGTDLFNACPYGGVGHLVVPDDTFLSSTHDLVPGQRWKAANTGITYVVSSSGALVPDGALHAVLSTSPTNTTTTLATASGLNLNVIANAKYTYEACLYYDAPVGSDIKFAVTGPAGGNAQIVPNALVNSVTNPWGDVFKKVHNGFGTAWNAGSDGTNAIGANPTGTITTAGTAGTIGLQFALDTSTGTATLFSGSWVRLTRISA